jgi:hypothetical protein
MVEVTAMWRMLVSLLSRCYAASSQAIVARSGFWPLAAIAAYRSASLFSAARTSVDASTMAMARRSGTISTSSACVTYGMASI